MSLINKLLCWELQEYFSVFFQLVFCKCQQFSKQFRIPISICGDFPQTPINPLSEISYVFLTVLAEIFNSFDVHKASYVVKPFLNFSRECNSINSRVPCSAISNCPLYLSKMFQYLLSLQSLANLCCSLTFCVLARAEYVITVCN